MPSTAAIRKAKLTVTISDDVVNEIDDIAKEQGAPRSQVIEEILRDWLKKEKRDEIEKKIKAYYLSLTENEKKEDAKWTKISSKNAVRVWK